jgi:hypothetical protein
VLSHATSRAGERFALSVYGAIAIGLLAVIQFVDNIPGNAVAVTFVGIFFGCVLRHSNVLVLTVSL